jgi:uncharacterized membrane protein
MSSTFHVYFGPRGADAPIEVRKLRLHDAVAALREGVDDFVRTPTHPIFVGIFYALAGVTLAALSSFASALQLVFPLAAGFALLGPFFAVGLYELSRRREAGRETTWSDAFAVLRSPALPSVIALGLLLLGLFALWLATAQYIYVSLYGEQAPMAAIPFLNDVATTSRGSTLIVVGCLVGFCFAAVALAISMVSFPLMIDRDVGLAPAMVASVRVTLANPLVVALWGVLVAAALVAGSAPLFVGLAIVMPVLGHATWRFYRRAIARDPAQEVPIADMSGEALVESPGLKQLWTFLDVLDYFRKGRV